MRSRPLLRRQVGQGGRPRAAKAEARAEGRARALHRHGAVAAELAEDIWEGEVSD